VRSGAGRTSGEGRPDDFRPFRIDARDMRPCPISAAPITRDAPPTFNKEQP
jgi:hypothetical protein